MTKFFLHGGKQGLDTDDNKKFFHGIVQDFNSPINFLCVYIARDKKLEIWNWSQMFEEDKQYIISVCPDKEFNFVMAKDEADTFVQQVKNADIVYFLGGITDVLLGFLISIPNLEEIIKEKTVAGSSAGALVWSKYYYDGDLDDYKEGLGLLPIKIICHWGESRYNKLEGLVEFGEQLEVFKIPEQKFIIISR